MMKLSKSHIEAQLVNHCRLLRSRDQYRYIQTSIPTNRIFPPPIESKLPLLDLIIGFPANRIFPPPIESKPPLLDLMVASPISMSRIFPSPGESNCPGSTLLPRLPPRKSMFPPPNESTVRLL